MKFDMEESSLRVLEKFYENLREELLKDDSLNGNSVFTTLIKFGSNKRKKFILNSSIDSIHFDFEDLNYLTKQGYLQQIKGGFQTNKPVLTAKGIWTIDKIRFNYTEEHLIDFFQEEDFDFSSERKPLTPKEKLALLSLVGVRCFSSDSLMDLKDENIQGNWVRVLQKTSEFLVDNKITGKDKNLLKSKSSTDYPARYLMRRLNSLPKKTSQVYQYTGGYKYYLDIYDADYDIIEKKKLDFIFELIFENRDLDITLIKNTSEFCNRLAYNEARNVIKHSNFIKNNYDKVIYNSLKSLLFK